MILDIDKRICAPSWVMAGTIAENAEFLKNKVSNLCLNLFETQACLNYTEKDLPKSLTTLFSHFNLHLPVDIKWPNQNLETEIKKIIKIIKKIIKKTEFLNPSFAVLHPPSGNIEYKKQALTIFANYWEKENSIPILLENISTCNIIELGKNFLEETGYGFCLDVGHLLGYNQKELFHTKLIEKAKLIHWSAPGNQDQHLALTKFTEEQRKNAYSLYLRMSNTAIHLIEVFNWQGIEQSIPILKLWDNKKLEKNALL